MAKWIWNRTFCVLFFFFYCFVKFIDFDIWPAPYFVDYYYVAKNLTICGYKTIFICSRLFFRTVFFSFFINFFFTSRLYFAVYCWNMVIVCWLCVKCCLLLSFTQSYSRTSALYKTHTVVFIGPMSYAMVVVSRCRLWIKFVVSFLLSSIWDVA